jgi:hypothetical protein
MNGLTILITLLVLIFVIGLVYFLLHFGYIDHLITKLDEITGQDAVIPRDIKKSLEPLDFKIRKLKPSGYSYSYKIEPASVNRTVLVTCSIGFTATLDGEVLVDVLNETKYKQTVSGLLFPAEEDVILEVFTTDNVEPVLHFAEQNASYSQGRTSRSPSPIFSW